MAKIIKLEDLDLLMDLDKACERLADMESKANHEKAFLRIALFIGKERLNLLHEVDDEKLEQLIDEGAKREG